MNALELKDIVYTYSKNTPFENTALHGVTVQFEQGKVNGLIGHTGSGKSTLVQMMNGLLKPDSGEVLLAGKNIWDEPKKIRDVRFRCGLVFQYPEYQLFEETCEKDIAFGPKNMGLDDEEIKRRVLSAVDFVGLEAEILQKSPFELSGGQKRRIAIAGIIAMHPEVLVLDEPAAGLDPRGRREILGGLSKYVQRNDATVILVSHSMEDMAYYCDNVVVMNKSKVYKTGTVDEIFSDADSLEAIGLDVPVIAKIASRLVKEGISLKGKLYTVEGVYDAINKYLGREKQ